MSSVLSPRQTDPHDVAIAALLEAHQSIERRDERLPRAEEQALKLRGDAPYLSDQSERLAVLGRSSSGRSWSRGFIGLLLAAGVFGAAFASHSSYGEAAKMIIARWAPQLIPTSPQPKEISEVVAQSNPPAAQAAAVEALPPRPGPLAQTTPQDFASAPDQSPELAQLLQTISHNIANLDQAIEQLKTSQQQVVRDNAKAIDQLRASVEQVARNNADATEQLKASKEQMARDNANAIEHLKASQEQISRRLLAIASDQKPPPKTSANKPPVPGLRPPQARAQPQSTRQQQ